MKPLLLFALLVTFVVLVPSRAEAGIPVYQSGEKAFPCGPLPAPYDAMLKSDNPSVVAGYKCDIQGIFWSYFSVTNCKPIAYDGDKTELILPDTAEQAAMVAAIKAKYPESSMQRGFWGRFGWMILAGVILLGIILGIKDKLSKKPTSAAANG